MRIAFRGALLSTILLLAFVQPVIGVRAGTTSVACSFDDAAAVATIETNVIDVVRLARSGEQLSTDGVPCGSATVTNTDSIVVLGGGSFVLDLAGGPFAPGLTDEGDGSSEIEFEFQQTPEEQIGIEVHGTLDSDWMAMRTRSGPLLRTGPPIVDLNLDAAESIPDADLSIPTARYDFFMLALRDGGDRFESEGAWGPLQYGVGGSAWIQVWLGRGDDLAYGGADYLRGQGGTDTIDLAGVGQAFDLILDLGDIPERPPVLMIDDSLSYPSQFELGYGHTGHDVLIGTPGPDTLRGIDGPDVIVGLQGNDSLFGGAGDDDLRGDRGNDRLFGGEGADLLRGGPDKDRCTPFDGSDTPSHCER